MKVLVTGAGALLGQGIIRALRASTLEPYVVATDPDPRATGLYWADQGHLVPLARSAEYGPRIREILSLEKPDAVLVGTDVELPFYSSCRDELEDEFGAHILVSSPHVVEIADDKWKTYQFLKDNGFSHPQSSLSFEDEGFLAGVKYPLVVKPRRGARSMGVHVVEDHSELERAFGALLDPMIQECVGSPDEEYTAGAIVFGGKCYASIVMRRELRDGNTYRAFVRDYPELNKAVRSWAEALGPHGPVNFQFRLAEGEPKVFEINARFSGTTPLRAHAGFNEVEMCLKYLIGSEAIVQPRIKPMVVLRHWDEVVLEWSRYEEMARF